MGALLGDLLPLAIGVAISPLPVMAAILILFAPDAGRISAGFLLGWVLGIVAAVALVAWLADSVTGGGAGGSDGSSTAVAWLRLALGALLVVLAVRQWRERPPPGQPAVCVGKGIGGLF